MKAKIISAFPGCGKTQFFKEQTEHETILDSDSSTFDKSDFPANYIKHIKSNLDKAHIIFVSSHDVVRDELVRESIFFTLVYPDRSLKSEYIERYKKRGNLDAFVTLLEKNWDTWIDELESQSGCTHIVLKRNEYISDRVGHLIYKNVKEVFKRAGFIDWNTLEMDKLVEHLEEKFRFDSSGTAVAVHRLVEFYKEHKK